jgi:hypothetical protein
MAWIVVGLLTLVTLAAIDRITRAQDAAALALLSLYAALTPEARERAKKYLAGC